MTRLASAGQVVKVQGGQIQLLEGWRPLTEVTDDKPWTLDSVAGLRGALLGATDGAGPAVLLRRRRPATARPTRRRSDRDRDDEARLRPGGRGVPGRTARLPRRARAGRSPRRAATGSATTTTSVPTASWSSPRWARDWQATLFDHGWMIPGYPPELGGRNATPTQTLIYLEEMARRGIPRSVHFGGYAIVGPSLLEFGNDEQRAMAPAAIRGDTVWCVGMSEPNAGSDLANLSTRAVDDGDSFVVNGQKVWTSYAMVAVEVLLLRAHRPRRAQAQGHLGADHRPRHARASRSGRCATSSGRAEFAEVFFTDVVVPKANLVGEMNDGWRITMGSLAHERGALWVEGVMGAQRGVDDLVALARALGRDDDPVVRRRIAELAAQVRALRALGYKGFASFSQGSSAPEHSFMKLATSELRQTIFEFGHRSAGRGPRRARSRRSRPRVAGGRSRG